MPTFRHRPLDAVLDVRSKLEYWMGHLEGATHLPVDRVAEGIETLGLPKQARILVYCASGMRSSQAASILRAAGYRNVVDGGGMQAAQQEYAAT